MLTDEMDKEVSKYARECCHHALTKLKNSFDGNRTLVELQMESSKTQAPVRQLSTEILMLDCVLVAGSTSKVLSHRCGLLVLMVAKIEVVYYSTYGSTDLDREIEAIYYSTYGNILP